MDNTNLRRDARTAAITLVCGLLLIGLGLTGVWGSQMGLVQLTDDERWWFAIPLTVSCVALVFKRRAPVTTLLIGFVALAGDSLLGSSIATFLPFFDLLYTAALISSPRVRRALWIISGGLVAAPMIYVLADTADLRLTVLIGMQQGLLFNAPLWWAMDVRRKTELAEVAAARADAVERLSLASRQQAVRQERDSLARDLHDVVASHLSAIALHSGGALATPPAEAKDRAALAQVRRSALESMEDMRTMIALLRTPDVEPGAEATPTPDDDAAFPRLTHLQPLVDQARANGLTVTVDNQLAQLPEGSVSAASELAGYRIVQEALTNAAKHAPYAEVSVQVIKDRDPANASITIRNTLPAAAGTDSPPGLGLGLTSMRERAAAIGGHLTAVATADHWTVTAVLPLLTSPATVNP
ncbi:histidine kinase [Arthrobacter sp. 260]|uniref:histidine kinase n=1 Tax=Arthrobacter sp. 260 TaxID=2735314 RepID=UPI001491E293|nr:two-component sensor histidine kinase [Arthrobacter sp. 260]